MKRSAIRSSINILAAAIVLSFASSGMAQRLLQANVSGKGRFQWHKTVSDSGGDVDLNFIKSTPAINSKVLINLALGRDPKTVVPSNLVLALSPCEGEGLIVYDKNEQTTVAVIATIELSEGNILNNAKIVCQGTGEERFCEPVDVSFEALLTLTFQPLGNDQFGIGGGSVQLYAKGSYRDGCPIKLTSEGQGTIDVTVTNNDPEDGAVTENHHVLLPKLNLSTSANLTPVVL